MSAQPLVSVVTIFLDEERFLGEAVASVLAQTYDAWELLLVDDGSRDGSTALARRFAAEHPERVRYLEHPGHENRGKSASRNLGLREARGEFVAFLDADDVFLPDKLERQVALLAAHPEATMVYGRTEYWFGWTGRRADRRRDAVSELGVRPGRLYGPPALVTHFLRRTGAVPCICGVLARRGAVMDAGGFDEAIPHLYEDQVLLARLCLGGPVFVEDGCGERYRQHAASSSRQAIRRGEYHPWRPNAARHAYLTWLAGYAARLGVADEAFRTALRRALWPYRHPAWATLTGPLLHLARSVPAALVARLRAPADLRARSG